MTPRARNGRYRRSGVPVWQALVLAAAACWCSYAYAYATRPNIETTRVVYQERPIAVEYQTVVRETFPVPVCGELPTRKAGFKKDIDTLAAAIPASALR